MSSLQTKAILAGAISGLSSSDNFFNQLYAFIIGIAVGAYFMSEYY
jgi:hypothetical protein